MRLHLDFETRSEESINNGVYKYAEHPSTKVLCVAFKLDNQPIYVYTPEKHFGVEHLQDNKDRLMKYILQADEFAAHNANFERIIWKNIMVPLGFQDISNPEKWVCTAAKAAAMALPRKLEKCALELGCLAQKDMEGHRIMMKWCKPRKPTKNNPNMWHDDPEEFIKLCKYCRKDVQTEYEIDQKLPDLSQEERAVWILDQIINDRGIPVDISGVENLTNKLEYKNGKLKNRVPRLGFEGIRSARQTVKIIELLQSYNIKTDTINAAFLENIEELEVPDKVKELLEIRKLTNKTSTAKLKAFSKRAQNDNRIRGAFLYHGATTGRWASLGVQFQNMPRTKLHDEDVEEIFKLSVKDTEKKYGNLYNVVSGSLRSLIQAEPGYKFIDFDFSNIEGRLSAWVACEGWKVQSFFDFDAGKGYDNYVLAYAKAFGVRPEEVTDDQRQVGKTMELALGYQGWVGALTGMAESFGVHFTEEEATDLCGRWRDAHPNIKSTWYELGDIAINAVKTGKKYTYKNITVLKASDWLRIKIPSGRIINYFKPIVTTKEHFGREKEIIQYHGIDRFTQQWSPYCTTHGGDIFQSIIQATARDCLVFAMQNLTKAGFKVILHVHDEVMVEEKEDRYAEMENIVCRVPEWATGLPLAVGGWIGKRFRK